MNKNLPIIITHAGSFHADEVLAIALLKQFFLVNPVRIIEKSDNFNNYLENFKSFDVGKNQVRAKNDIDDNPVNKNSRASDTLEDIQKEIPRYFFIDGVEDLREPVLLLRTRDKTILNNAKKNNNTFVIDVGGEYSPYKLNFDHHQKNMNETWLDGTPLSSAGLIWKWLLSENLINLDKEIIEGLEGKLIKPIDLHDNGITPLPLAGQISTFNRLDCEESVQNEQFMKAVNLMQEVLNNEIYSLEMRLVAKREIEKAWKKAQSLGKEYVLLNKKLAYKDCPGLLKEVSDNLAKIIIIPGDGNRFSVISLSNEAFSSKSPAPKDWRGKMDMSVNINGRDIMLRFIHKSGFMVVVEGNSKDAQIVASHIIKYNNINKLKPGLK